MNWRIAAFDYYYNTGDTPFTKHHAVIVPDTSLYSHNMNDTNKAVGAYVGSGMYTEGLEQAKTQIQNAFGASHVLTHNNYRIEKGQLPLFQMAPQYTFNQSGSYWLRDVISSAGIALVNDNGIASTTGASYVYGVRPAFCIG